MSSILKRIGTDVEAFCTRDGAIYPLRPGDIEGKKAKPHIINEKYDVGIQLDNVLAEITFMPASSGEQFKELCEIAKLSAVGYLKNRGLVPEFKSHHVFEPEEISYPHAKVAGCEPDYPAVEGEKAPVFNHMLFQVLRTGSGHIHIEVENATKSDIIQYVRGLDRVIGAPLCLAHNDPLRRKLYGQAGRFRYKPYGFEYRTPDNYWYSRSESFAVPMWDAINEMFSIPLSDKRWDMVNYSHKELAEHINMGSVPEIRDSLNSFDFPQLEV